MDPVVEHAAAALHPWMEAGLTVGRRIPRKQLRTIQDMTGFAKRLQMWFAAFPVWGRDSAMAAALTAFTQWEISRSPYIEGEEWVQRVTFAVMTTALAGRRIAPAWAAIVGAAGLAAQTIWGGEAVVVGGFLAGIVLVHSVGFYAPTPQAVIGLLAILAGVHTYTLMRLDEFNLADEIGNAAIFLVVWSLARAVRSRQSRSEIAEAHAARVEAERGEVLRAAVADERARIARDLHDVVAHGVSVMVLQAGAARQVLDTDPLQVRQPLLAIEASGRHALEDMHRLLGILRRDTDGLALAPVGGLAQVDDLARQMGQVGLSVEVRRCGSVRPLGPSLEMSAYRVIQEALTNALKHGGATAIVTLRFSECALEIEVRDTAKPGAPRARGAVAGAGHGLIGMRERVALFDGEVDA
ncbi:MAG: sensor histidine kinase, partial [Acidimicrobiia bacterium]